jgi:hypothetical protein
MHLVENSRVYRPGWKGAAEEGCTIAGRANEEEAEEAVEAEEAAGLKKQKKQK